MPKTVRDTHTCMQTHVHMYTCVYTHSHTQSNIIRKSNLTVFLYPNLLFLGRLSRTLKYNKAEFTHSQTWRKIKRPQGQNQRGW